MLKDRVSRRFSKASSSYGKEAFVQRQMGAHLRALLPEGNFQEILELGCGSGNFSKLLVKHYPHANITLNDLSPQMLLICKDEFGSQVHYLQGDAQELNFSTRYDLIIGCASFQWFENLEESLKRLKAYLKPQGILAFAIFSPEHFAEIKAITGLSLNYPTSAQLAKMLTRQGFDFKLKSELIVTHFKSALEMLRHFKATGIAALSSQMWTRGKLLSFIEAYERAYSDNEGVRLTWAPLYAICTKKADA